MKKLSEALDIEPIEIINTEIIEIKPKDSIDDYGFTKSINGL